MRVRKNDRIGIVLFLAPALLLFFVFFIIPIVSVSYMSLFKWNGISNAEFIGIDNYLKIFSDKVFLTSMMFGRKTLPLR